MELAVSKLFHFFVKTGYWFNFLWVPGILFLRFAGFFQFSSSEEQIGADIALLIYSISALAVPPVLGCQRTYEEWTEMTSPRKALLIFLTVPNNPFFVIPASIAMGLWLWNKFSILSD